MNPFLSGEKNARKTRNFLFFIITFSLVCCLPTNNVIAVDKLVVHRFFFISLSSLGNQSTHAFHQQSNKNETEKKNLFLVWYTSVKEHKIWFSWANEMYSCYLVYILEKSFRWHTYAIAHIMRCIMVRCSVFTRPFQGHMIHHLFNLTKFSLDAPRWKGEWRECVRLKTKAVEMRNSLIAKISVARIELKNLCYCYGNVVQVAIY